MIHIHPTTLIITLNVSGINITIKSQTWSDWIKKQTQLYCLQDTHFQFKETSMLKAKGYLLSPLLSSIMLGSLARTTEQEGSTKCVIAN